MPELRSLTRRRPLLALIILILLLLVGYGARALNHTGGSSPHPVTSTAHSTSGPAPSARNQPESGAVGLSSLPPQARATVALIQQGGPYPYSRDGVVFNNAERHLPIKPSGYYHEYTVPTPGSSDRGTRRIITGSAGELYYTGDHYASFVRVDLAR
jgi:ribonuclease T1